MTENDPSVTDEDGGAEVSAAFSGDPAHELFGGGWAPRVRPAVDPDYTGRHRASEE